MLLSKNLEDLSRSNSFVLKKVSKKFRQKWQARAGKDSRNLGTASLYVQQLVAMPHLVDEWHCELWHAGQTGRLSSFCLIRLCAFISLADCSDGQPTYS